MYAEEYERRGFPLRDFLLKLILVVIFVALLVWLLPKFIKPTIVNECKHSGSSGAICDTSGIDALTSQIFMDNLEKMKNAAISYYTDDRLPQKVGDSAKMTLSDMIGKHLIVALIDKNNKAVDVTASYVKITKNDDEYIMRVNLKDSEKEDYILVHLGCYTYCDSYICEKQNTNTFVKGGLSTKTYKPTSTIPIKVYPSTKPNPNVNPTPSHSDQPIKYYCSIVNGKYYGKYGDQVTKNTYKNQCEKPDEPTKYYCSIVNGKYYGKYGKEVTKSTYKSQCEEQEEPTKYYCSIVNGKYYGKYGKEVTKDTFKRQCEEQEEPTKYYCSIVNGKYYGKYGKEVTKSTYKKQCEEPEEPTKYYCSIIDGKYYGKYGKEVTKETYIKQCLDEPDISYLYEYKKITGATFSKWTSWSAWEKTNCATKEVNCSDKSVDCLKKVQRYDQKEKIGTYEKKYVKDRQVLVQTGSYKQRACSKYNYVIINNTTYVTTTTTSYTQVNTITSTTRHTTGSWVYSGRETFKNPPKDTANTAYKFVGMNFDPCNDTCESLPSTTYDVYKYSGGLTSVANTTSTPGNTTSSTSSSTTSSTSTSVTATCGSYVEKTIPIYGYITVSEIDTRREPLYGTVCYKSTKTRDLLSVGTTKYKWSVFNDTALLEAGWNYTGARKPA